jgi:hypothetical protein
MSYGLYSSRRQNILNLTDNSLLHVQPEEWYDVSKTGGPYKLVVAAVSPSCTPFNYEIMQTQLFVQTGNNQATGAAILIMDYRFRSPLSLW